MVVCRKILLAVVLFAIPVLATRVAVLETIAASDVKDVVLLSDRQYLTNVLREQAVIELPAEQDYTIMTRENINAMLPPGKSIEECEGTCLAETGRNIAADYVCQAYVGRFDGSLTLSAELYETAGNKLVASFNGQGSNVKDLLDIVKEKTPSFFRKVKGVGSVFGDGGISKITSTGDFSFGSRKKFIVEIVSSPAEAVPTIDGKAVPKCLSTPCKVQLEEGNHRFVATKDHYDDAEMLVEIRENNQKVALKLEPNFGWLEINPVLGEGAASKGFLNVAVDGFRVTEKKIRLDPGIHSVRVMHPCYDPVEFKVPIVKQQIEIFNQVIPRGKGGLELNVEYNGEPQAVAVFIDGVESGSTPYVGEVPLCAEVVLKGKTWIEKVAVMPKWHEVVKKTHRLQHTPESVAIIEGGTRTKAQVAYDELDGSSSTNVDESFPTNVKQDEREIAKWVVLGISSVMTVTGVVLAVVGNANAKNAHEKGFTNKEEYERNKDEAHNNQVLRGVGIGLAIAGALGVGISFTF